MTPHETPSAGRHGQGPARRAHPAIPTWRVVVVGVSLAIAVVLAIGDPRLGLLAVLGFGGAFVSGLIGVGGAIILIPLLLFVPTLFGFAPLDIRTVAAITIVQVAASGVVGVVAHRDRIDRSLVLAIAISMTVASLVGAVLSAAVAPVVLEILFALTATAAAVITLVWRDRVVPETSDALDFNRPAAATLGAGVGFLAGMIGGGGAFMLMPAMLFGLRVPLRSAVGASLAVVAISAAGGLVGKGLTGQVDWLLAAALVSGAVPGSAIGAVVSGRTRVERLSTALGLILAIVSIRMWIGILA